MTPHEVPVATAGLKPSDILSAHMDLIRRIVRGVARRHRLNRSATEELESAVWVRLIEHDYRAIRQYEGRSALATFLTVVVTRLALDVRTAEWGRWRPSSRARKLGDTAVQFETLVFRDGYSTEEATAQLESRGHPHLSCVVRALRQSTRSMPRRFFPLDVAEGHLAVYDDPGARLVAHERSRRARTVSASLSSALSALGATDRLLLRMRHAEGLQVSTMARVLGQDPRALYRRLATLHRQLRHAVEQDGVTASDAADVVGFGDVMMRSTVDDRRDGAVQA